MELKLKSRESGYCNLKLVLLFLVVYGHLIEPCVSENRILYEIYRMIYMVHIPLFVFLSGVFLKDRTSCLRQSKKALVWYLAAQSLCMVSLYLIKGQKGSIFVPYWHLWYLLSLASWALIGTVYYFLAERWSLWRSSWIKIGVILVAIIAGCLAGGEEEIERTGSLSRTIVFLPYFLAGMFWKDGEKRKTYQTIGKISLIVGAMVYCMIREGVSVIFLYQADGYGTMGMEKGCFLRVICYLIGGLWILFLLTHRWEKRIFFTKVGADTMFIYVFHAPIYTYV